MGNKKFWKQIITLLAKTVLLAVSAPFILVLVFALIIYIIPACVLDFGAELNNKLTRWEKRN